MEILLSIFGYRGILLYNVHEAKGPEAAPLDFLFYQILQGTGGSWGSEAGSDKTQSWSWVQQNTFEGDARIEYQEFQSPPL